MSSLFGEAFLLARIRSRQRQGEIAKEAGIDPSYLTAIEKGRRKPPARETLYRLVTALNVSENERRKLRSLAAIDRLVDSADAQDAQNEPVIRLTRLLAKMAALDERDWKAVELMVSSLADAQLNAPAGFTHPS